MKILHTKTLFLALLVFLPLCAYGSSYDFEVDDFYYRIRSYEDYSVYVTYGANYNSYSGDVTIPETVTHNSTTYTIKAIDYSAFRNCTELTSITIPDNVTYVGHYAFYGCI